VGILLAFVGAVIPATAEETKIFIFTMMNGMALAYVTSALAMTGALILYVLNIFYSISATHISRVFREKMFRIVFPTIHSKVFGYKGNLEVKDE